MASAIWVQFRSSNFRHVTDDWELTVKIFTLKWGKDNETATSSYRYISEAIKKVIYIFRKNAVLNICRYLSGFYTYKKINNIFLKFQYY